MPASRWQGVPDPRGKQGRRYRIGELLQTLVLGMVLRAPTLRDVERAAGKSPVRRELGLRGAPSDTTPESLVRRLTLDPLRVVLHAMAKEMWRSRRIEIDPAVGISHSFRIHEILRRMGANVA